MIVKLYWRLALQHAAEAMKDDREVVMQAVKQCGPALEYATYELKAEQEFMLSLLHRTKAGFLIHYSSLSIASSCL